MIRSRLCTLRKLVYLLVLIVLVFVFQQRNRNVLVPTQISLDHNSDVSPRVFASIPLHHARDAQTVNKTTIVSSTTMGLEDQYMAELRSMGIDIVSDPLDLRHQVHPSMNEIVAEDVFHTYVSDLHVECKHHVRLGNVTDGGWDMCVAGPYRPTDGSCLVYSFGIGDNWSFDDAISKRFGCTVRSFDPSINVSDHQRSKRISFYHVGLGSRNTTAPSGWKLMTLGDILSARHDEDKIIDYLKIDVESYEWDALEDILQTGNILSNVKQLAIKVHTKELDRIPSTKEDLYRYWTILHGLEVAGFRRWYWHFNIWGFFPSKTLEKYLSCCYETVYININYLPVKMERN